MAAGDDGKSNRLVTACESRYFTITVISNDERGRAFFRFVPRDSDYFFFVINLSKRDAAYSNRSHFLLTTDVPVVYIARGV